MQSKHAKSPCCAARVRRFGPRRRQCVQCHRTWTVRPKKRGRPLHRTSTALLHRVLVKGYTLGQLFSDRAAVALPAYRYRFRQALHRWVSRPSPQHIPSGQLVLLTDGLWFEFEGIPWVLYLVALKPCRGHRATFLDPLLLPGREGAARWQQAVAAIPAHARKRIRAIVADNLPGIEKIARQQRWVLQLCHFHLLLKLQAPRRRVRYALRGGAVREEIYQSIRNALLLPEGKCLSQTLERLRRLSRGDCGTLRIKTVLCQFLVDLPFYRSYLAHPDLGLPLTTNAVESMCRLLREMLRSSRAGSNPRSLLLWATALIRLRPTVTCNGYSINRNS
jgi:transposase-like protein